MLIIPIFMFMFILLFTAMTRTSRINVNDADITALFLKVSKNVINILSLNIKLVINLSCLESTHPFQCYPLFKKLIYMRKKKSSFIKDHHLKTETQKLGHSSDHITNPSFTPNI